ncbi:sensor histidine kinase [Microbacterium dauci]|uniref:histidine kinase n=1 Tax=Microbacterium dauci TaxID=3048008 RepID=A0ABT6ZFN9_9MICO|nr:sensor histidine kinase [Microbacterium sp. LX3-4]MDJ1114796.1 sensor histidine kinase [Microbacterium sp. LX3-4]
MTPVRAWDTAVAVATAVLLVVIVLVFPPATTSRTVTAVTAVAVLVAAYLLLARGRIDRERPGWRGALFVGVAAAALGAGTAAEPFLAIAQTLAYPLVWVIMRTERQAIAGSVLLAAGVLVGTAASARFSLDGWLSGALTAGASLTVSIVFGLWISSIARSAEERGRLMTQLADTRDELEALSRQQGAAAERERLAREIHDTLAQTLAGLVILAERAGRQSGAGNAVGATETMKTVEDAARAALGEARALVAHTAAVPGDQALEAAVHRLVERFRGETGLRIDLTVAAGASLDRETQVVVLRCLQEALANVRKHAHASLVTVSVEVTDVSARLRVVDDGRGFDASAPRRGFGLDGMADRVSLAGGVFEVVPSGSGTVLTAEVPRRITEVSS